MSKLAPRECQVLAYCGYVVHTSIKLEEWAEVLKVCTHLAELILECRLSHKAGQNKNGFPMQACSGAVLVVLCPRMERAVWGL